MWRQRVTALPSVAHGVAARLNRRVNFNVKIPAHVKVRQTNSSHITVARYCQPTQVRWLHHWQCHRHGASESHSPSSPPTDSNHHATSTTEHDDGDRLSNKKQKLTHKQKQKKKSSSGATTSPVGSGKEFYTAHRVQELYHAGLLRSPGLTEAGAFSYPNQHKPSMPINQFITRFSHLQSGQRATDDDGEVTVSLAGRIGSKRSASSKLHFYDLVSGMDDGGNGAVIQGAAADKEQSVQENPYGIAPKVQLMASRAEFRGVPDSDSHATPFSPASPSSSSLPPSAASSTSSSTSPSPLASSSHSDGASYFTSLNRLLRRGDVIWVEGIPTRTGTGELTLLVRRMELLAPCMTEIPERMEDVDTRCRQRYLDMLVNRSHLLPTTVLRSRVLASLRRFLEQEGFLEVETPILWTSHGGANARPFKTESHALSAAEHQQQQQPRPTSSDGHGSGLPLFLRIAPELFLKQLVIGGIDRVFEISKVFRNEGMDSTHNPEFTTCEFYKAYATYTDLMPFTQRMLQYIVHASLGAGAGEPQQSSSASASSSASSSSPASTSSRRALIRSVDRRNGDSIVIDFDAPFQCMDIMDGLKDALGVEGEMPDPNAEASIPFYLDHCHRLGLHVATPITNARVIDKLVGHLLEPQCIQPTFLLHHPQCLSPLAKKLKHPTKLGLTERFELFINGQEYANAYSELNDPADQHARMIEQARDGSKGDEEAQPVDQEFCRALEYGLPPTAGWGLGIDRLVMLLAGTTHIRDVLLFPIMKPMPPAQSGAANAASTLAQDMPSVDAHS